MVAATTLIDYQYRYSADAHYDSDAKTAFFGFVGILGGCATVLFQLSVLDRLLDKLGLFGTATVMPGALIGCLAAFGLLPSLITLVALKATDSGANMSLQQATGNLLLAPLSPRARAVWQGRIDGFAKRGSQLVAGLFLAVFPWTPSRVLPVALLVCALWIAAIVILRSRYVRLLTEMLGDGQRRGTKLEVYDGSTLRLLERELAGATPARAAVVLDLFEQAGHRAPDHLLQWQIERDPQGPGSIRVLEHLTCLGDVTALVEYAKNDGVLAGVALIALADLEPRVAQDRGRQILAGTGHPEPLCAIAAGILAEQDPEALAMAQRMSRASDPAARLGVVQALGRASLDVNGTIGRILHVLANDAEVDVARTAIEALGAHPSGEGCEVTLRALHRREVRGAAMRALAAMGQPAVGRVATELRSQTHVPSVAEALTWVLGRIGAAHGLDALLEALSVPIVKVRLNAAAALSTLHRRRPELVFPREAIAARYLDEIRFYARMRDASLAPLPETPAGKLLLRTLRERAQSSLETLFRILSIHHPEDAMQGAFRAISSRDPRQRQIALELLDTVVAKEVAEAIAVAVGGVRAHSRRSHRDPLHIFHQLAEEPDLFLASLTKAALLDANPPSVDRRQTETTGEIMAQTLVRQILELQSLNLFGQSSAEDLAEVAAMVSARRVAKDTVLFREEEVADAMYLVRSGEVTLSREGKIIDHIGPGEACGIVAILDQLPREYTAATSMESKLLVIRGDDLLQLLADRPLLMHSVFRALTAALRSQLDRGVLGKRKEEWSW
jgi:HEAT repeat protein